jgi:hypothetical protein
MQKGRRVPCRDATLLASEIDQRAVGRDLGVPDGLRVPKTMGTENVKTRTRSKRGKFAGMAKRADKYTLYQEAVQDPDHDVRLARRIFKKHFGRDPHLLREDFCGTFAVSCCWVCADGDKHAWGIDLDPEPLAWGREHNLSALTPTQQARVHLMQADVREAECEKVDVTCAFNFSYFLFKERQELLAYFAKARTTLRSEGMLMLDAYGGADAQRQMKERRDHDSFTYVWDQYRFDPVQHNAINRIHFEFPDGSQMKRAFEYDWRLWTLPELRDILIDAGFSEVEVYWEGTDHETGEGNGIYHKAERAADDPAWVSYIVALL